MLALGVFPGLIGLSIVSVSLIMGPSMDLTSMLRWVFLVRVRLVSFCFACYVPRLFVGLGLPQPLSQWSWLQMEFFCHDMEQTWLGSFGDVRCHSCQKDDQFFLQLRKIVKSSSRLSPDGVCRKTCFLKRCLNLPWLMLKKSMRFCLPTERLYTLLVAPMVISQRR